MGVISLVTKGNFKNTKSFFDNMLRRRYLNVLSKYGDLGVSLLSANTPLDSGLTASSWSYEITEDKTGMSIVWKNNNFNKGANIAILLQYGHATGNGGYVRGVDYINPALQPVFDKLAEAAWREVQNS